MTAAEGTAAPDIEVFGWYIQWMAEYLYYEDELLASMWETRLHQEFDILADLFGRFRLRTKVIKMLSMAYQPFPATGGNSEKSYGLRMMVEGLT